MVTPHRRRCSVGRQACRIRPRDSPRTIKMLDLVDVVAGGDGFSGRRDRGHRSEQRPDKRYAARACAGREGLHRRRPQVSSCRDTAAGGWRFHSRRAFGRRCKPIPPGIPLTSSVRRPIRRPATSGRCGVIHARRTDPRTELGGVEYGSPGHALLYLPSNNGVTFDLAAIRRANPGCKLLRFRAMAGNTETASEKGAPCMPTFGCWSMVKCVFGVGRSMAITVYFPWWFPLTRTTAS